MILKASEFKVTRVKNESFVIQEDILPYFFNHYHKHNEIQITAILEGHGNLNTKGGMIPFSKGNVFVIGENQPHLFKSNEEYFKVDSKKIAHSIHIYFSKEILRNYCNLPEFEGFDLFLQNIGVGLKVSTKFEEFVFSTVAELNKQKGAIRFINFLKLINMLSENIQHMDSISKLKINSSFIQGRINDIYDYTLKNYHKDIRLESVAKIANMTVPYMCKYFKSCTRKTYMEFLKEVRIDIACQKIWKGEYEFISEIAYEVGFNSPIIFNRAFKRKMGMTPTEFLNKKKLH